MRKSLLLWLCLSGYCLAGPLGSKRNMPIIQRQEEELEMEATAAASENDASKPEAASANMLMISTLTLPSNATSIRADITDGFSCANKSYGYYADVENDCQIFHVCLPVTYADGRENTFRWSFICPEETIFSQDSFTCMRREDMAIDCEESFKFYKLNRNFGMTQENENKHIPMSIDVDTNAHQENEDQQLAMATQPAQMIMDEKIEKPKPMQIIAQKEKPLKVQKTNRRKPSTIIGSNSNKKKTAAPLRKESQPVPASQQPAVIATTTATSQEAEDNNPPRLTKRPSSMSTNLKEKLQPVKQSNPVPVRVDLYNQKRKRPFIFNKKDATTLKPVEEVALATEIVSAHEPTPSHITQSIMELNSQHNTSTKTDNVPDLIVSQASETSSVVLKPESSQPSTGAQAMENKKISKPKPTEPEVVIQPYISKAEELPVIVPLEAIEEIPAVITEIEEINSRPELVQPVHEVSSFVKITNSETTSPNVHNKITPPKAHLNEPVIFQENSEESLAPPSDSSIEEMEDKKPDNAPEIMPSTPDMDHQHPTLEQIFTDEETEANKQTMGSFKPVDPAMAAEAEALIANFLNTLIKSDKTNAEPIMPFNDLVTEETKNSKKQENLPQENEKISSTEVQPQVMASEAQEANSNLKTHIDSEKHTSLMGNIEPFPSMMMNIHPGEIFQIPVQVIQSPIDNLTDETPVLSVNISSPPKSPKPIGIDDIVELVKDKLDQVPTTISKEETQKIESNYTDGSKMVESAPQHQTEQLILPIYHRISAQPNSNMVTAHDNNENLTTLNSANMFETKMNATEAKGQTNTNVRSNNDRGFGARSIKTTMKMDPRKRRFLFKSDAS